MQGCELAMSEKFNERRFVCGIHYERYIAQRNVPQVTAERLGLYVRKRTEHLDGKAVNVM
jgi:hypothetical protein